MRDDTFYALGGPDRKSRIEARTVTMKVLAGPQAARKPPKSSHIPFWVALLIVAVLLALVLAALVWPGLAGM